jgi:hypothetical protein
VALEFPVGLVLGFLCTLGDCCSLGVFVLLPRLHSAPRIGDPHGSGTPAAGLSCLQLASGAVMRCCHVLAPLPVQLLCNGDFIKGAATALRRRTSTGGPLHIACLVSQHQGPR